MEMKNKKQIERVCIEGKGSMEGTDGDKYRGNWSNS